MAIPIKSPDELGAMRRSGIAARRVLDAALSACRAGATTRDVDAAGAAVIRELGAISVLGTGATERRSGFAGHFCVNVNEEAAHGFGRGRILRAGDLVSVDVAIELDGWWADVAEPVVVGGDAGRAGRLRRAAGAVTQAGVAAVRPGAAWSEVVDAIGAAARRLEVRLVGGLDGHGVGRELHEAPSLAFGEGNRCGLILRPGMVITIEPTITEGDGRTIVLEDAWTTVTADRGWACFAERTIGVTRAGGVDLTAREKA